VPRAGNDAVVDLAIAERAGPVETKIVDGEKLVAQAK
jgi:hypothetical protein